jgi:hypothetical protein
MSIMLGISPKNSYVLLKYLGGLLGNEEHFHAKPRRQEEEIFNQESK